MGEQQPNRLDHCEELAIVLAEQAVPSTHLSGEAHSLDQSDECFHDPIEQLILNQLLGHSWRHVT
jgi:hypothetical protein